MTGWTGHPWATADHRPLSGRASCSGCSQYCYPHDGCWCCSEPAREWLLAEARWWAEQWRGDAWDYCRGHDDPVFPVLGEDVLAFPWERL